MSVFDDVCDDMNDCDRHHHHHHEQNEIRELQQPPISAHAKRVFLCT